MSSSRSRRWQRRTFRRLRRRTRVAQTEGQSGSSLPLILAILGVILLAVAFVTPVPAPVRRRNRR